MAKATDIRPKITMACADCKNRNYITKKNRRNDPDRIELRKFCPHCGNPTPVKRCNVVCALLTGAFVAVLVLVGVGMSKAACMKAKARAHAIRCCEEVQTAPVAAPVAPERRSPRWYSGTPGK